MIVSIRELSTSILLYSPDTQVVSIVIWELWENGQYVELSALGVLFIITLFLLVLIAQWLGRKYGVKDHDRQSDRLIGGFDRRLPSRSRFECRVQIAIEMRTC